MASNAKGKLVHRGEGSSSRLSWSRELFVNANFSSASFSCRSMSSKRVCRRSERALQAPRRIVRLMLFLVDLLQQRLLLR